MNGPLWAFVDAAQTLVTLFAPGRSAALKGDGGGGAVFGTKTTPIAGIRGIKGLCTPGEVIESEIDYAGFQPGVCSLLHAIYLFPLGNLLGQPLDFSVGCVDFLPGCLWVVNIRADDVIVGHHQAVTAVKRVDLRKLPHGQPRFRPAGADAKGEGIR